MTKDCTEVFTDIYARRVWGDGSGGGSGEQAQPYCDFITKYLPSLRIEKLAWESRKVLDIGCGDLSVYERIDWGRWRYIGIDAGMDHFDVSSVHQMMGPVDALKDSLPDADLVLCKEVLQHLSNEQVQLLLDRTAHYRRRLFTNTMHPDLTVNTDIETGDCRAIDLTLDPFNQPAKTVFKYGCWHVQELTR